MIYPASCNLSIGLWKGSPGQAALVAVATTHKAPLPHNKWTNRGQAAKHLPLAMTPSIMRNVKHRENRKCMVFQCILPDFGPGFEHLCGHKFPLDQYALPVFLFALVKMKIQWPGRSGKEMNKWLGNIRKPVRINSVYSHPPPNHPSPHLAQIEGTEGRTEVRTF